MAIYIQINKVEDLGDPIVYEFGPSEAIIGKVAIQKATGDVVLIEIDSDQREQLDLPRVRRALLRHYQRGAFPDRTCFAA